MTKNARIEMPQKKSFIVVGATGEIGTSIVKNLVNYIEGIFLIGRKKRKLSSLCKSISPKCNVVTLKIPDNISKSKANSIINAAFAKLPLCSGMVVCVGNNMPANFVLISKKEWERIHYVNLTLPFYFIQSFIKASKKIEYQNRPVIVILSSIAGTIGFPNAAAYCSAKHGIIGIVRSVASEFPESNLKIYAVCPGLIYTKSLLNNIKYQATRTGEHPQSILLRLLKHKSIKYWLSKDQIGNYVSQLMIGNMKFRTGKIILLSHKQ